MTFMRKFLDMLKIDSTNQEGVNTNVTGTSSFNDEANTSNIMDNELPSETKISNSLESTSHEDFANASDPKSYKESNMSADTENTDICYEEDPLEEELIEKDSFMEKEFIDENIAPYRSKRMIINGVHLYFIDIAREIVEQQFVNTIPLMREYHLSEFELQQILK